MTAFSVSPHADALEHASLTKALALSFAAHLIALAMMMVMWQPQRTKLLPPLYVYRVQLGESIAEAASAEASAADSLEGGGGSPATAEEPSPEPPPAPEPAAAAAPEPPPLPPPAPVTMEEKKPEPKKGDDVIDAEYKDVN